MRINFRKVFGVGSAICLVTTLLVFAYVCLFVTNPHAGERRSAWSYFSIGETHISITENFGGRIVLFIGEIPNYGITLSSSGKAKGWNIPGMYFRQITNTATKESYWTLMVSFFYPIIFWLLCLFASSQRWFSKK